MNEDGHVLKSRRGLLAAGLAVAVVGAIGVASTLNAGAEQVPGDRSAARAPVADRADDSATLTPPPTLPWGGKPHRPRRGKAGMSSRELKAKGLDAAAPRYAPTDRFAPKGFASKSGLLRSEPVDALPPSPAPSPSATTTAPSDPTASPATSSPTTSTTTAAAPVAPLAATTTTPATTTATTTAASAAPAAAATTPPGTGGGSQDKSAHFLYAIGSQGAVADGMYAMIQIYQPVLAPGDFHTLAELSVGTNDNHQMVEVGWSVDRGFFRDSDPHLFVYNWINGKPGCYNGCGFVPYDGGYNAGDTVVAETNKFKKFGIEHFNNAWWIAYDTSYLGSFPDSLWSSQNVTFTHGDYFQAFGEVAAASDQPCTQMGNGQKVSDGTAGKIGAVTFINGPPVNLTMQPENSVYGVAPLAGSNRSFSYGGPGATSPDNAYALANNLPTLAPVAPKDCPK